MKKGVLVAAIVLAIFLAGMLAEKEIGIFSRVPLLQTTTEIPKVLSDLFFKTTHTVEIPALPEFVFKDNITFYRGDIRMVGGPWSPYFGGKDYRQFVDSVEEPKAASVLQYRTIGLKGTSFANVLQELGGEAKAVSTFAQIYFLIRTQKDGRDGPLRICEFRNGTRHNKNLFFVKSSRGIVYPVEVEGTRSYGETSWRIYVKFYGERQKLIDSQGIAFKFEEVIPGDVVFYPN